MKTQYTTTVSVQGKGATKAAAFSDALSHVQSEVMKGNAHILLRIEPQDVEVVQALVAERKEAFLFFFLRRTRSTFSVTLNVTVNVTSIDVNKVAFITR